MTQTETPRNCRGQLRPSGKPAPLPAGGGHGLGSPAPASAATPASALGLCTGLRAGLPLGLSLGGGHGLRLEATTAAWPCNCIGGNIQFDISGSFLRWDIVEALLTHQGLRRDIRPCQRHRDVFPLSVERPCLIAPMVQCDQGTPLTLIIICHTTNQPLAAGLLVPNVKPASRLDRTIRRRSLSREIERGPWQNPALRCMASSNTGCCHAISNTCHR